MSFSLHTLHTAGKTLIPDGDFQIESGIDFQKYPKTSHTNLVNGLDNHSLLAIHFDPAFIANGSEVIFKRCANKKI